MGELTKEQYTRLQTALKILPTIIDIYAAGDEHKDNGGIKQQCGVAMEYADELIRLSRKSKRVNNE